MKPSKNFYQWDINQKFTECDGRFVDFIINEKVVYRVDIVNGECIIPDEFLQKSGYHTVYECMSDYTIQNHMFPVHPREKPPGYVYTPTEKLTFEGLVQKVNDTVADIIHRADTGEFDGYTPVKGEDYFTEAEKNEMVQSVSSGAVGEFREVVNSATSDFNKNSSAKTNEYNTNAEKKLSTYNSNDAEKLKAYNDNHTEKMTAYDTNDADKLSTYNRNAAEKMEAYNQNHTAKVAEYNQNAETKTAEFDANAAALQTEVDRLRGECDKLAAEKANIDGYYEEMTVGDAEQLVATQFVEDNKPYLFRSTGGSSDVGNRAYLDKIVGGTVVWNQLYDRTKPTEGENNGITFSHQEDGSFVATGKNIDGTMSYVYKNVDVTAGHIYFSKSIKPGDVGKSYLAGITIGNSAYDRGNGAIATASQTGIAKFVVQMFENGAEAKNEVAHPRLFDLTLMFGAGNEPTAEQFERMFPKDYYPYNTGELLSVEGLQSHDTVGFNQFDKNTMVVEGVFIDDANGAEESRAAAVSTDFIQVIPNATYFINTEQTTGGWGAWYDANKNYISGITGYANVDPTYKVKTAPSNAHYMRLTIRYNSNGNPDTLCINLSDPSRNGEYEPYKKHSYPLDSSLTLRGIPKLDESNNLFYDGDEYTSDGKVKRKYGIVDLGALTWTYDSGGFKTPISGRKFVGGDAKINYVLPLSYTYQYMLTDDKTISFSSVNTNMWIKDSSYATTDAFKAAMSGVMLVYELATPTTETAEPFQHIQIVDDFGTEEFGSTGIVPVGHKTRYPANLRDKLQHLPSLANADGTYLIQQSGKQMSLIHMPAVFPDAPTEDGTYTLKTVVTGGTPTLQWVAE